MKGHRGPSGTIAGTESGAHVLPGEARVPVSTVVQVEGRTHGIEAGKIRHPAFSCKPLREGNIEAVQTEHQTATLVRHFLLLSEFGVPTPAIRFRVPIHHLKDPFMFVELAVLA